MPAALALSLQRAPEGQIVGLGPAPREDDGSLVCRSQRARHGLPCRLQSLARLPSPAVH